MASEIGPAFNKNKFNKNTHQKPKKVKESCMLNIFKLMFK